MYLDFTILRLVYTCWIPALRSSQIWSRPICFSPWGFWLLLDDIVSDILKSSSAAILIQGTANSPLDENLKYHSKFIHSSSERMSFKCREWNLIAGKPGKGPASKANTKVIPALNWVSRNILLRSRLTASIVFCLHKVIHCIICIIYSRSMLWKSPNELFGQPKKHMCTAFPGCLNGSGDVSIWSLGLAPVKSPSHQGLAVSLSLRGCPTWSCVRHSSRLLLLPAHPPNSCYSW